MFAKIVSVSESEGVLAPYWEFEYAVGDDEGPTLYGTLSADAAIGVADRTEVGAVFDMCSAIKNTAPSDFGWLVGRVFDSAAVAPTRDQIAGR